MHQVHMSNYTDLLVMQSVHCGQLLVFLYCLGPCFQTPLEVRPIKIKWKGNKNGGGGGVQGKYAKKKPE